MGYTDSLSQAIIFMHQTVFKIYGKITEPWNRGHSEAWEHGRMDEWMERRKTIYPSTYCVCQRYNHWTMKYRSWWPTFSLKSSIKPYWLISPRYHIYTSNSLQNISQNHWTMIYRSQWPTFILRSSIKSYWLITPKYYVYISNSLQGMRKNHWTMKYSTQSTTFILRWSISSHTDSLSQGIMFIHQIVFKI